VSTASPAVPPISPGEASPGFLSRLVGLYVAPIETFRAIAAHPTFLAPLLAIVLVNSAFTFVWLRKADHAEIARAQMEDAGVFDRVPPERHAEIVERQVRMLPIFAWLGPTVFLPLMLVALGGLFLFVYRFFYASETTYRQSLAVMAWAHLTFYLLATLLLVLILTLKDEWSVDPRNVIQTSPAALVEKSAVPKPVHSLLDSLDLMSFWLIFLLSAGYAATARRSVGSAAVGVIVLWGIYVLLKVALAAVF
jgi:Yip1-like protein